MRKGMDKGGAKAERGYPGPTRGVYWRQQHFTRVKATHNDLQYDTRDLRALKS